MGGAEQRPVASEETAEEGAFGDDEEQASDSSDNVTTGIEEEELPLVSFGVHCGACSPTLETMKVLTSMTTLLATTEASAMMFRPRITLRMM